MAGKWLRVVLMLFASSCGGTTNRLVVSASLPAPVAVGRSSDTPGPAAPVDAGPGIQCVNQLPTAVDFVFMLDDTDSTCADGLGVPEFVAARQAIETFELAYPFRYGLVVAPGCGTAGQGGPTTWPLAAGAAAADGALVQCVADAASSGCGSSNPFWLDLLAAEAEGGAVSWDPGAQRVIVLFTSGPGLSSQLGTGKVARALAAANVTVLAFVNPAFAASYQAAIPSSGQVFLLGTAREMLTDIETSITNDPACD